MKFIRLGLTVTLAILFTGCATSFTGDAHITPKKCEAKCQDWDMEFVGMVGMGEYSDGCVCKKKGKAVSQNENSNEFMTSAGGVAAATVGVVTQMRQQEAAQQID